MFGWALADEGGLGKGEISVALFNREPKTREKLWAALKNRNTTGGVRIYYGPILKMGGWQAVAIHA